MEGSLGPGPYADRGGAAERAKRFRPPEWVNLVFVLAGVLFVWLGFLILVEGISSGQAIDFLVRAGLIMAGGVALVCVGIFIRTLRTA